jgi:arginyl-tRNA synthetase
MTSNLFDYFENTPSPNGGDPPENTPSPNGAQPPWTARAPGSPNGSFDLILVPRSPKWQDDSNSVAALARIEAQAWVGTVVHDRGTARLRLADTWVEAVGAALEAGGSAEAPLTDLAGGQRFSLQFWDPNATKALHAGHLRNLALGNGLAAALTQAGGQVERRSLISDIGRSMGEAMAGVMNSGSRAQGLADGDEKSDHFVGACYADYVASSGGMFTPGELEQAEDSLSRELRLQDDAANELIIRVLHGEQEALDLWYKTRAWVISGHRKTLARLGVSFDRVLFESDFLTETAELAETGLRDGVLTRREDGVLIYATGLAEFEEMSLVRADGLPTQHMRSLAYCMSAPELDELTSLQVTGTEWVSHRASVRKLAAELRPDSDSFHPSRTIFHGMVARQKRALASSEGALLIDDLLEWLDGQIDGDPKRRGVLRVHPSPERVAAQVALGFFLHHQAAADVEFDPETLLGGEESLGWDIVRARAHHGRVGADSIDGGRPADDPDYRFVVVQSELYRRYLRLAVERLDIWPLAHYLKRLLRWYLQGERGEHVERVVQTLLDRSERGLGLDGGR